LLNSQQELPKEKRNAENAALIAENAKAKQQFLSNMSHEIVLL
jgi:signal transduction histidine kinase